MNSKTYIDKYRKPISLICFRVNEYARKTKNDAYLINDIFFLRFISDSNSYYDEISISKNSNQNKRLLFLPNPKLKYTQKFILHNIFYKNLKKYNIPENVNGFLKNKSIVSNAKTHLNKNVIIKLDIKDFFPSISRNMVQNTIKKYHDFSYDYAYILSKLLTHKNQLPQGAPTSPFVSNLCALGIDKKIIKYINKLNNTRNLELSYSRYADDITISLNGKYNYDLLISSIDNIIEDEGFELNYVKTKIIKKNHAQRVTGILVNNNEPRIDKKEIKKIDFITYIWGKYGINDAIKLWNKYNFGKKIEDENHDKLVQIVHGKISFFKMVNDKQTEHLINKIKTRVPHIFL